ncbi:hypothetical protein JAAARDRAFT_50414 [Jaapia argillacea MUCL 33604]|uniref:Uncharacterized protein n=1 Tax=Jaapia argillacea MUCL 33604 TaxID=933084 RepID=A0A067PE83_9AGAM|nr:hypothetical protein JAAARDRAFT_50414 [Jaapia argillacea MUCL 33604]
MLKLVHLHVILTTHSNAGSMSKRLCLSRPLVKQSLLPNLFAWIGVEPLYAQKIDWEEGTAGTVTIHTRDAGLVVDSLCLTSVYTIQRLNLHINIATLPLASNFIHLLDSIMFATEISVVVKGVDTSHWSDPDLLSLLDVVSSQWNQSLGIYLSHYYISIKVEFPPDTLLGDMESSFPPLDLHSIMDLYGEYSPSRNISFDCSFYPSRMSSPSCPRTYLSLMGIDVDPIGWELFLANFHVLGLVDLNIISDGLMYEDLLKFLVAHPHLTSLAVAPKPALQINHPNISLLHPALLPNITRFRSSPESLCAILSHIGMPCLSSPEFNIFCPSTEDADAQLQAVVQVLQKSVPIVRSIFTFKSELHGRLFFEAASQGIQMTELGQTACDITLWMSTWGAKGVFAAVPFLALFPGLCNLGIHCDQLSFEHEGIRKLLETCSGLCVRIEPLLVTVPLILLLLPILHYTAMIAGDDNQLLNMSAPSFVGYIAGGSDRAGRGGSDHLQLRSTFGHPCRAKPAGLPGVCGGRDHPTWAAVNMVQDGRLGLLHWTDAT